MRADSGGRSHGDGAGTGGLAWVQQTQPLSAAAAVLLLDPARWHGREAVKITLLTLLARDLLRLRTQPGFSLAGRRKALLELGRSVATPAARDEQLLYDILRRVVGGGTPLTSVVAGLREQFGRDLKGFDRDVVRHGLIRRGMVTENYPFACWLFRYRRDALTEAGLVQRRRIEAALERARADLTLLVRDPAAAAALTIAAGPLIFLIPELRAHYALLGAALREHGGGRWVETGGDFDGWDGCGFEAVAFSSFDDAIAGFDAGFSSSRVSWDDGC
jgi:hypothetical protein